MPIDVVLWVAAFWFGGIWLFCEYMLHRDDVTDDDSDCDDLY